MPPTTPQFLLAATEIGGTLGLDKISFRAPGAFKETFEAIDRDGRIVAFKILDPNKCSLARVSREIDAMKRCSTPRIAQLYEHGSSVCSDGRDYLFVVEEFLDGGTLTSRMSPRLEVDTVRQYAICLVEALEHLYGLNLVHRDIKPDNIMFRSGVDEPVLVDFGLVRDLSASSVTPDWLPQGPGSPFFASPEQLNNDKALIQWRSDQFCLGVVLALCLTDRHPFQDPGMSMGDTVAAVAARKSPAKTFVDEVTAMGLGNIVKMVEPWPINRYGSPRALMGSF